MSFSSKQIYFKGEKHIFNPGEFRNSSPFLSHLQITKGNNIVQIKNYQYQTSYFFNIILIFTMGPSQPVEAGVKRKRTLQQARIQGLYEMYSESIRVSTMIKDQSEYENGQHQYKNGKYVKRKKALQNQVIFLKELMESFHQKHQYSWGNEISKLFMKHFSKEFQAKWYESKQFFYELLLQNSGIQPQSHSLVARSHLIATQKQKKLSQLKLSSKIQEQKSFENYFIKIIKQRNKNRDISQIKSSFAMIQESEEDSIDRRKDQEIVQMAEFESMRMTGEESVNFINSSIIDAQQQKIFSGQNEKEKDRQFTQKENDDEYFLPLITKRNKLKKNTRSRKPSDDANPLPQPLIQMSQFQSKAKYSRFRLQSSSIILPSTIFYQRMNFNAKVQTDQLLKIYRQLSNTIQQTINSCNLISCPLKHFILYFEFKTSKKNINQLSHSSSFTTLAKSVSNNDGLSSARVNTTSSDSSPQLLKRKFSYNSDSKSSNSSAVQDLYILLTQTSEKSQIIRKKRQFNTNYLLKEIRQFAQAYTQFLYKYLNFSKIEETDLENFINLDTVYGIVLRNIWNIVTWIADRGYEWEEYAIKQMVYKERNAQFTLFSQEEAKNSPNIILESYAKFANKDINKIRTDPSKFVKAYSALLKLKGEVFPQKYLKKIIIFYREATKCCEGADDLMTLYQFLLKNSILNGLTQDMHLFRMKNIIEKLIPIESSSIDGAGEIVYAWTTWNIILQMFMLKLNEHKQMILAENQQKRKSKMSNHANQYQSQKKINSSGTTRHQGKVLSTTGVRQNIQQRSQRVRLIQNPERNPIKKLQY